MPQTTDTQNNKQSQSHDELLHRCADNDLSALQEIVNQKDEQLIRKASRVVSMPGIKILLDNKATFPAVEEFVLEEAALAGKADVVRYVLQQNPKIILSENVRYYSVGAGVPVWKELIAFDPKIVNVEIGHHGDALGLAVGKNNAELVAFLLDEGKADIEASNYAMMPVLPFAIMRKKSQEIVDLLISHGARMKDSVDD